MAPEAVLTEDKTKVETILVSQPEPESEKSPYHLLAKKFKLEIDFRPFIQIEGLSPKEFRKSRIIITDYSAIVLTSRTAIDHFFRICDELRVRLSQEIKYFCISEAIALYLQKYIQYRKRKVFYGNGGTLKELKEVMLKYRERENILYLCSDIRKNQIPEMLEENNFDYTKAVIYRTVPSDLSDLSDIKYDMIVFFSPAGVMSLFKNFPDFKQGNTKIAAFGPATCNQVIEAGLRLDVQAPIPEARSMPSAIENYITSTGS